MCLNISHHALERLDLWHQPFSYVAISEWRGAYVKTVKPASPTKPPSKL